MFRYWICVFIAATWICCRTDSENECLAGTFGPGCNFSCIERHCGGDKIECDALDGKCEDGCQPGWKGVSCIEQCIDGVYGENCTYECHKRHCRNEASICDNVTGSCDGGCQEGWHGADCTTPIAVPSAAKVDDMHDTILGVCIAGAVLFIALIITTVVYFRLYEFIYRKYAPPKSV